MEFNVHENLYKSFHEVCWENNHMVSVCVLCVIEKKSTTTKYDSFSTYTIIKRHNVVAIYAIPQLNSACIQFSAKSFKMIFFYLFTMIMKYIAFNIFPILFAHWDTYTCSAHTHTHTFFLCHTLWDMCVRSFSLHSFMCCCWFFSDSIGMHAVFLSQEWEKYYKIHLAH